MELRNKYYARGNDEKFCLDKYLTKSELQIICQTRFDSNELEELRDCYVFACFTGISMYDLLVMQDYDIYNLATRTFIKYYQYKTGMFRTVRLFDIPLAIIRKYRGKFEQNQILPVSRFRGIGGPRKALNLLREIARLCGINKALTFHVAHRTFIKTILLGNEIEFQLVQMICCKNVEQAKIEEINMRQLVKNIRKMKMQFNLNNK